MMTSWRWAMLGMMLAWAALGWGCRTPTLDPYEVLKMAPGQRLHTAYNLWHAGSEMPSLNYQVGTILPFGTEVEVLRLTEKDLNFRVVATGQVFHLRYRREYGVEPISGFLAKMLVAEDGEAQASGMPTEVLRQVRLGQVVPGMTKAQVIKAWGYPARHRTPSTDLDAWIYWRTARRSGRVFFKGDTVVDLHF
jgi:hypothetical protein